MSHFSMIEARPLPGKKSRSISWRSREGRSVIYQIVAILSALALVALRMPETIAHKNPQALQPGTLLRYKGLEVGKVENLSLTDDLHWIAGARMLSADGDGAGYGSPHDTRVHGKVTPYTGLVYDLTSNVSLYTQYSTSAEPPGGTLTSASISQVGDFDLSTGSQLEVGSKFDFLDGRGSATVAATSVAQVMPWVR